MTVSRVFHWAMLCSIGGVGVGLFFSWSLGMVLCICAVAIASLVVWRSNHFLVSLASLFVLLIFFFGSWFRTSHAVSWWESLPEVSMHLDRAIVIGRVEQSENAKQAFLQPLSCGDAPCPRVRIVGFFPNFSDIDDGDILSLSCALERPKQFTPDFDYPKVLAKDSVGYLCRFPQALRKEGVTGGAVSSVIRKTRTLVEGVLEQVVPEPESGLLLGLLVGGDGRLPKGIQDDFSRTGLSHIVAVSGYNVSIIAILCMNALIFLGLYRQQAFWGALFGVVFFTLLVGAPASAVRAAVMVSVALLATRLGRVGDSINGILLAATAMLLINPLLLRYDIGFQLSFAATLGIFLVTPFALLSLRVGDIIATTLAAELFVLPIILFHFHALPTLSLAVNFLVLPLVPFAMIFGVLAWCLSVIVPWLGMVFGFPAFLVSRAILEIIHVFSSQKFASIPVQYFDLWAVLLWYGFVGIVLNILRRKFSVTLSPR